MIIYKILINFELQRFAQQSENRIGTRNKERII